MYQREAEVNAFAMYWGYTIFLLKQIKHFVTKKDKICKDEKFSKRKEGKLSILRLLPMRRD